MSRPQGKVQALWWLIDMKSKMQTQIKYTRVYQKDPLLGKNILQWTKKYLEIGSVLKSPGHPCTSSVDVEHVIETHTILGDQWQENWICQF